jgi:sigma-B regulation protein RsbU (phosphoserine phosphatase)
MQRDRIRRALSRLHSNREPGTGRTGAAADGANPAGRIVELEGEIERLRRAVDELSLLNELAREIGSSFSCEAIMDTLLRRSIQAVGAEQGVITLVDRQARNVDRTLVRVIDASDSRETFHLQQALVGWVLRKKTALRSDDPGRDARLRNVRCPPDLRNLLCLPLMHHGELIGVLSLCNKRGGDGFGPADERLLSIIAGQSAQIVEDARQHEEEERLAWMREQVRLAREIQVALLPRSPPALPGYQLVGLSLPVEETGGDYYDYFRLDKHCWALCLGDISGKGLPASLLMANLQGNLRGMITRDRALHASMSSCGGMLFRSTAPEKFATLFCAILDTRAHTLTYCNAGHERPYHFHGDGEPARLATGGLVLGALESFPYQEETVAIGPGDLLVAVSDGVTDAESVTGEPFGDERLRDLLRTCRGLSAQSVLGTVIGAVREHVGDKPRLDDITLVVLKRVEA